MSKGIENLPQDAGRRTERGEKGMERTASVLLPLWLKPATKFVNDAKTIFLDVGRGSLDVWTRGREREEQYLVIGRNRLLRRST